MQTNRPLLGALARSFHGGWRLFTLRRAARTDFAPSADLFAALVVLDLLLLFAFGFAAAGFEGEPNLYELPRALMFVPLVLALGMLARRIDERDELLVLPVALAAASLLFTAATSALYLLAQRQWLPFLETYWVFFDSFSLAWSAAVVIIAAWSLTSGAIWSRAALGLSAVVVLVLPAFWLPMGLLWMPRYDESAANALSGFHTLADESAFYAQHEALQRELSALEPERPGIADVYVVAAGLYAGEDVFMKEVEMIAALFRDRYDAGGRTVTLINNPRTVQKHAIASLTSIREALRYAGAAMNAEEDLLVLYVSSHSTDKHELVVDFRPIRFASINPKNLRAAVDESGARWKVIVISACYSGGFIDALKDERTLIITASSADRQSFGCGNLSDATYLAQALFGDALRQSLSFEAGFERARTLIEQWEREKGFKPSQPQLFVGSEIRPKLAEIERRLATSTTQGR